jgi:hypothetical protein
MFDDWMGATVRAGGYFSIGTKWERRAAGFERCLLVGKRGAGPLSVGKERAKTKRTNPTSSKQRHQVRQCHVGRPLAACEAVSLTCCAQIARVGARANVGARILVTQENQRRRPDGMHTGVIVEEEMEAAVGWERCDAARKQRLRSQAAPAAAVQ